MKTKHDHDLWMINKIPHDENLATPHVDEILIWSKDPRGVIKSLEKTYLLKNVDIPEYHLGGVELQGDSWKKSWFKISHLCKNIHSKCHTRFEGLLERS
jgi:hypothetical protein